MIIDVEAIRVIVQAMRVHVEAVPRLIVQAMRFHVKARSVSPRADLEIINS
jgi:hypothetical protein